MNLLNTLTSSSCGPWLYDQARLFYEPHALNMTTTKPIKAGEQIVGPSSLAYEDKKRAFLWGDNTVLSFDATFSCPPFRNETKQKRNSSTHMPIHLTQISYVGMDT